MNLGVGTDRLASTLGDRAHPPRLSLLAELREMLSRDDTLRPEDALPWVTVNGARALGLSGEVGELREGSRADAVAIPYQGGPTGAVEAVVHHPGPVAASLIGGHWAIPPRNGAVAAASAVSPHG